jgi:hypothetical protein
VKADHPAFVEKPVLVCRGAQDRVTAPVRGPLLTDMRLMLDRFCADGMSASTVDVMRMTQLLGRNPRSYADFAADTRASWTV